MDNILASRYYLEVETWRTRQGERIYGKVRLAGDHSDWLIQTNDEKHEINVVWAMKESDITRCILALLVVTPINK